MTRVSDGASRHRSPGTARAGPYVTSSRIAYQSWNFCSNFRFITKNFHIKKKCFQYNSEERFVNKNFHNYYICNLYTVDWKTPLKYHQNFDSSSIKKIIKKNDRIFEIIHNYLHLLAVPLLA